MRAYVVITGLFYVALFLAHVARVVAEGPSVLQGWAFIVTSLCSLAMAAWSWRALKGLRPTSSGQANAA